MKAFVDTTHYHLWTDTLHARSLARQAMNHWDRGTYVRWVIITGWSVLEMSCRDALDDTKIGYSFKRDIDKAISRKGITSIDWSKGIWQKILCLLEVRKTYVHVNISQERLFATTDMAESAVSIIREAIKCLYGICGKISPAWLEEDNDRGWDKGSESVGHLTLIDAGAADDPEAIKVGYVHKGDEKIYRVCRAGTDPEPIILELMQKMNIPITAIVAYKGNTLLKKITLMMRGA